MTKKANPKPKPAKKTYRKTKDGRPIAYRYVLQNGRYIPVNVETSNA